MTDAPGAPRHRLEWVLFILTIGITLRFQGLDWDAGHLFNPDERNLAHGAAALAFPHGFVPQFHAYNGLALYLPRALAELIALFAGGEGNHAAEVVFAGRVLSALWSSLSLLLILSIARRLCSPNVALLALLCAAFTPALVQTAHFATTEAALILCLLVIIRLSVAHMEGQLSLSQLAAWAGLATGIGFGFKTTALIFAVCPILAVMDTTVLRGKIMPALMAGLVATIITFILALITTPQIWALPGVYFATMQFENAIVTGAADVYWTYQFHDAIPLLYELWQLPYLMGPVAAVLGLGGLGLAMLLLASGGGRTARLAIPAIGFTLIYGAIIVGWHARFVRYLLPIIPLLLIFAASLVSRIPSGAGRKAIALLLAAGTIIPGLLQAAVYQVPDPRLTAWKWLAPRIGDGRLVVEVHDVGPEYWVAQSGRPGLALPLLDPSTADKPWRIAEMLAEGDWMIVASRRHHGVLPHMRARFPEMCGYYDALWSERLGYQRIATFKRSFYPPMAERAEETLTVFDSPQVIILQKIASLSVDRLVEEITRSTSSCPDQYSDRRDKGNAHA